MAHSLNRVGNAPYFVFQISNLKSQIANRKSQIANRGPMGSRLSEPISISQEEFIGFCQNPSTAE
jgi:hypothetical protein